jgi:hypothetical protein
MRKHAALLCLMLLASCGGKEELPEARTSIGLAMDGSHNVQLTGAVNEIGHTSEIDHSVSPEGWATAPVPLPKPYGFAIATRSGMIMVYDDHDSLSRTIVLESQSQVDQLLTRGDQIYVVLLNGQVHCYKANGKYIWGGEPPKDSVPRFVTANAIIAGEQIWIPCERELFTFGDNTGKPYISEVFGMDIHSLAYSEAKDQVAIALTKNVSGGSDSLITMRANGGRSQFVHRYALSETRITSNIAIIGEDEAQLAYGFLGAMEGPQRTSAVTLLKGVFDGKLEKVWTHSVPYVIGNVAANDEDVMCAGIREQGELTSGLDAFRIDDTIHTWSRRFSEPLVAPFGVSNGNVYLHLSFRSDAVVETRGIFYTLNARTGKTLREQSIPGAEDGFLPHIPMPDERGRFLLADGAKLVVYLLDRSSFERVFK